MCSNVIALLPLIAAALASPLAKPVRHKMNIPAVGNRADEDAIQEYNKRADEDAIQEYNKRKDSR
ncbi:hypothetical protein SUNI508_10771 [Seiridium unicorne]|uniref:Uncharacterized protein n=1 Tax=Seiridium unicorne TaxID=138068 RepID=A0ABR2UJP2_9PEZI